MSSTPSRLRCRAFPARGAVRVELDAEGDIKPLMEVKFERTKIAQKKRNAYRSGIGKKMRAESCQYRRAFKVAPSPEKRRIKYPVENRDKAPDAHARCCNVAGALHRARCELGHHTSVVEITRRRLRDAAKQRKSEQAELQKCVELFEVQERIVAELLWENERLAQRVQSQRDALMLPRCDDFITRKGYAKDWTKEHARATDVVQLKRLSHDEKVVVIQHMIDNLEDAEEAVSADNVALAFMLDKQRRMMKNVAWL